VALIATRAVHSCIRPPNFLSSEQRVVHILRQRVLALDLWGAPELGRVEHLPVYE